MDEKDKLKAVIEDFIAGQIANAESPQAARLAYAIREAIREYKAEGGENEDAFSVDAFYDPEEREFRARVSFSERPDMIIMYQEHTDSDMVRALYNEDPKAEEELCRLAGLMLSEGWVEGYKEP